jgi:hypothetical protein
MQIDRTTKFLLALLVIGVWGLLLKPYVEPLPVLAQGTQSINHKIAWDASGPLPIHLTITGQPGAAPIVVRTEKP